ncbi:GNAT family N-acetyltransferase [Geodermatophilus sp. URMC 62]|uniref:GNAT family N-acetyltransferase n=1 Tax=Geodermatophilus sp. URMC 62 TaxID=3423414 RepID=UPI00406C8BE3
MPTSHRTGGAPARSPGSSAGRRTSPPGEALAAACLRSLAGWGVRRCFADGDLPTPATHGIPEAWPHVAGVLTAAGFDAVLDGEVVGSVEAQDDHTRGGSLSRLHGWADLAELHVAEHARGAGIGTWLVAHMTEWLRLGGTRRFLVALGQDHLGPESWFARCGWHRIGRVRRGWER